jgi:hypothetical protein
LARQACASCHFNAGADSRAINQVNPGQAGGDNNFQIGVTANGSLGPTITTKQVPQALALADTMTEISRSVKWAT